MGSKRYNYYEKVLGNAASIREKQIKATVKMKAALGAMEVANKKSDEGRTAKVKKENSAKTKAKDLWVKNLPTNTQEKKVKMKVQKQVATMNVQLAAKKATIASTKKNLANHVKLRDSLKSQIANLQGDLDKQSGKLSKEKAASAAEAAKVSTKEASMKQAIKK